MPFVSAILLAAGESVRMGRQKALVAWGGATLLEYQLAQLSAVDEIGEVIVVTGHEPDNVGRLAATYPIANVVHNDDYRAGKVSSIKAGLAAMSADADAILLIGVDQPRPASVIGTLIRAHVPHGAKISVPTHTGRRGHPLVFARELLPELLAISEETQGVRTVMRDHASEVCEVEFTDPIVTTDLNTPADVAAVQQ